MSWLLVFALLLALPATAHKHKWEDKSKDTQCELINKELQRAVKYGTITQREADYLAIRCNNRKP